MAFRKAVCADADAIMAIITAAQAFMCQSGLPQWQDGYPTREIIDGDIARGESYVLTDGGEMLGTAVVTFRPEPSYEVLADGAWLQDGPYASLHRVAVKADGRKRGTGTAIFEYAERLAREGGASSLRGDTHRLNLPMQGLLTKCGFVRCGSVMLLDSVEKDKHRVVYQKILVED